MLWQDTVLTFLMNHGSTVGVVVLGTLVTLAGMFISLRDCRVKMRSCRTAREEQSVKYSCNVCLLLSGDMVINSYDVVDPKSSADWASTRMVRLSAEAVDLCFADCLKKLLYSKTLITPSEIDPKNLGKRIAQFCCFPSHRKLDEGCKLVQVSADRDGNLELLPTKYERNAGFAHCNDLVIHCSLYSDDLPENIREAFALSTGSCKWNT